MELTPPPLPPAPRFRRSSRSVPSIRCAHVALSANRNPDFAWRGAPAAGAVARARSATTRTCPRAATTSTRRGASCRRRCRASTSSTGCWSTSRPTRRRSRAASSRDGVTARGKPGPHAPRDARQGVNDYTGWFAGDKDMAGNYFGYDGPCPPWNDAHRRIATSSRSTRSTWRASTSPARFTGAAGARARWRGTSSRRRSHQGATRSIRRVAPRR